MKIKIPPKTGRYFSGIAIAAFIYFMLTSEDGCMKIYQTHRENRAMEKEIVQLNSTIDSLQNTLEKLRHDTAYIERIAREKLGMAKKNEKVYKFIEKNDKE